MDKMRKSAKACACKTGISDQQERRLGERRLCKSDGYCYIEMVGWMDRRERERRKDYRFCC